MANMIIPDCRQDSQRCRRRACTLRRTVPEVLASFSDYSHEQFLVPNARNSDNVVFCQFHLDHVGSHITRDSATSATGCGMYTVCVSRMELINLQPAGFARSIQMGADTTELTEKPHDLSQPLTVKLHEESFRSYKCDLPSTEVQVTKDELLGMYKQMQTMRRMEMAADALYKAKLIRGFCHLAIGQVRVHAMRWDYTNCRCRKRFQLVWRLASRPKTSSSLATAAIHSR